MKIEKATKKPEQVEAVHFGPDTDENEVADWCDGVYIGYADAIVVFAPEETLAAARGDWIIRNAKGEFYPRRAEIFEATYEV